MIWKEQVCRLISATLAGVAVLAVPAAAQNAAGGADASGEARLATPQQLQAAAGQDTEVLARGPLHEAFATPATHDPAEQLVIDRQPPEPIDELIPEHKPAGDNVAWLPGYWDYDQSDDDFIWISGVWRKTPPGRQWVPGYWQETGERYRWNPGVWVSAGAEVAYRPEPPQSQERGASSPRPSDNHFYVPGNWVHQNNQYRWRPGYWSVHQRGWTWVPARYTRAGNRYLYSEGYWDYPLYNRGTIFAPVRFRNSAYTRAGFRYRPASVIAASSQLLIHLFVGPQRRQFAYGNYYGDQYAKLGYQPWFQSYRPGGGYDPLLSYYEWTYGDDFVGNLRNWHRYFANHPDYRPRATLSQQLAFAVDNPNFDYLSQTVLGNTLSNVAAVAGAGTGRLVPVTDTVGRQVRNVTQQVLGLADQRSQLESTVGGAVNTVNRTLQLPDLPVIGGGGGGRSVVPNVPRNPIDLRNVTPRSPLPRGGGGGGGLVPGLPSLPF